MGFGGCDEHGCDMNEIIGIIENSSADADSNYGLALLANGSVIANGGE